MGELGRAADAAGVESGICGKFRRLEPLAPPAGFGGGQGSLEIRRGKKEDVISQAQNHDYFRRERLKEYHVDRKYEAEERDPLDLHGNDQKEQNFQIRSQRRHREKERKIEKKISLRGPENQRRSDAEGHAEKVIGIQAEGPPAALEQIPEPPGEHQVEDDPKKTLRCREKDPRDQTPDLAMENRGAVQLENLRVFRGEGDQNKNQRIQRDDVTDEARNRKPGQGSFKAFNHGFLGESLVPAALGKRRLGVMASSDFWLMPLTRSRSLADR